MSHSLPIASQETACGFANPRTSADVDTQDPLAIDRGPVIERRNGTSQRGRETASGYAMRPRRISHRAAPTGARHPVLLKKNIVCVEKVVSWTNQCW